MYVPPYFRVTDRTWVLALIARNPFGVLTTCDGEFPRVSHLPLVARERDGDLWVIGHVARANPHAASIAQRRAATIVFSGAHAYVSASWYERPYETVPTWNYTAAHLNGYLRECDAWKAVDLLSEAMEGRGEGAWHPERLTPHDRESQLQGIVGFELRAQTVHAKAKLSQNRSDEDRARVIARLAQSQDQTDRECAAAMAACNP